MPHISIYVDESGDVGFAKRSSKFFSVGYVIINSDSIPRINSGIKELLHTINLNIKHSAKLSEFKFSSDPDLVKTRMMRHIRTLDLNIGIICANKDLIKQSLRTNSRLFYNSMTVDSIVELSVNEYLNPYDTKNSINFIIDKSLTKRKKILFDQYFKTQLRAATDRRNPKMIVDMEIAHEDSRNHPLLQVADYVAGAIQLKMGRGVSKYYDMISRQIKHSEIPD